MQRFKLRGVGRARRRVRDVSPPTWVKTTTVDYQSNKTQKVITVELWHSYHPTLLPNDPALTQRRWKVLRRKAHAETESPQTETEPGGERREHSKEPTRQSQTENQMKLRAAQVPFGKEWGARVWAPCQTDGDTQPRNEPKGQDLFTGVGALTEGPLEPSSGDGLAWAGGHKVSHKETGFGCLWQTQADEMPGEEEPDTLDLDAPFTGVRVPFSSLWLLSSLSVRPIALGPSLATSFLLASPMLICLRWRFWFNYIA